jgi:hypothetical protein
LQRLYRDWDAWRGTRAFPTRSDFDPLDLRYILGNFSLVDVLHDPLRFRYRLHATESVCRLGLDLTGKYVDAVLDPKAHAIVIESLVRCVEKRAPFWISHERLLATQVYGRVEVLVLPFSSDGETIDLLGVGAHFTRRAVSAAGPQSAMATPA